MNMLRYGVTDFGLCVAGFPSLIPMNDQLSHRQDGRLQWRNTTHGTLSLQHKKEQIIFCHTRQKTRNRHQTHLDKSKSHPCSSDLSTSQAKVTCRRHRLPDFVELGQLFGFRILVLDLRKPWMKRLRASDERMQRLNFRHVVT